MCRSQGRVVRFDWSANDVCGNWYCGAASIESTSSWLAVEWRPVMLVRNWRLLRPFLSLVLLSVLLGNLPDIDQLHRLVADDAEHEIPARKVNEGSRAELCLPTAHRF